MFAAWIKDALIEAQRVLDAVAREGIDHEPLLVGRDRFLRRVLQVENPLVDVDHRIPRRLEVQAGGGDDVDGPAELQHDGLLGLLHREQRHVADDHDEQERDQRDETCDRRPHRLPPLDCGPVVGGRLVVNSPSGR
jgi:hypothetical protein